MLKKIIAAALASMMALSLPLSASAGWEEIAGGWRWEKDGSYATGWQYIDNTWYHFDEGGLMNTGWLDDNGTWYYLAPSGKMLTGWQQVKGKWYYLDESGAMYADTFTPDGYRVDENGAWRVFTPVSVEADPETAVVVLEEGALAGTLAGEVLMYAGDLMNTLGEYEDEEEMYVALDEAVELLEVSLPLMLACYDSYAAYTETAPHAELMKDCYLLIDGLVEILEPLDAESTEEEWLAAVAGIEEWYLQIFKLFEIEM